MREAEPLEESGARVPRWRRPGEFPRGARRVGFLHLAWVSEKARRGASHAGEGRSTASVSPPSQPASTGFGVQGPIRRSCFRCRSERVDNEFGSWVAPSMTAWKLLERRLLLDRPWLRVYAERLLLHNGNVIEEFHLFDSPPWVAVIPIRSDGQLILVRQYRRGLGRESCELPAGVIEPGESPRDAAARELLEETGGVAEELRPLIELSPEPSRSTHRAHFFIGYGVRTERSPALDATEELRTELVSPSEVLDRVERGRIDHAAHAAAILLAERRGWLCTSPESALR